MSKTVKILSGTSGKKGAYLDIIYQPDTGTYFAPIGLEGDSRTTYETEHTDMPIKVAIIDTGFMLNHPLIKRNLEESVDFTGEGPEDLNGHGTIGALILLLNYPAARLFNVKVMDAMGRGNKENLIKGIEWSVKKATMGKGPLVEPFIINLSVGVYHKKWGLWECQGNCELCRAALRATLANVGVTAAAGNEPGKTYCPAKVGVVKKLSGVLSVGAYDLDRQAIAPSSGIGKVYSPVGTYLFRSVEFPSPEPKDRDKSMELIERAQQKLTEGLSSLELMEMMEQAIDLDKSNYMAYYYLAQALDSMGMHDKAQEMLNKYRKLLP